MPRRTEVCLHSTVCNSSPGYVITLDHRKLKTPGGTKLVIPKDRRLLAFLMANEWENQEQVLKQHALPMVGPPWLLSS